MRMYLRSVWEVLRSVPVVLADLLLSLLDQVRRAEEIRAGKPDAEHLARCTGLAVDQVRRTIDMLGPAWWHRIEDVLGIAIRANLHPVAVAEVFVGQRRHAA